MATKAEVRNQALQLLGVLRIGQSATAQDTTEIETAYDEIYLDLKKEGLATWAATGEVPDELSPYVSGLVALSRNVTYGISQERYQRLILTTGPDGNMAKREIRRLTTPKAESLEEPTDF